jgi:hypothetical protein
MSLVKDLVKDKPCGSQERGAETDERETAGRNHAAGTGVRKRVEAD